MAVSCYLGADGAISAGGAAVPPPVAAPMGSGGGASTMVAVSASAPGGGRSTMAYKSVSGICHGKLNSSTSIAAKANIMRDVNIKPPRSRSRSSSTSSNASSTSSKSKGKKKLRDKNDDAIEEPPPDDPQNVGPPMDGGQSTMTAIDARMDGGGASTMTSVGPPMDGGQPTMTAVGAPMGTSSDYLMPAEGGIKSVYLLPK